MPKVPLKVAKASLELQFGTILSGVGWARSNRDFRGYLSSKQLQLHDGTWSGKTSTPSAWEAATTITIKKTFFERLLIC